jgi:hypothetical protein
MAGAVTSVGGSPPFQQGEAGLQSHGRARALELGFSPGISQSPVLKGTIKLEAFPRALKSIVPHPPCFWRAGGSHQSRALESLHF